MALGEQGKNRIITKTFENPAKHFSSRAGLVSSFVWFDFILKFIYQRKLGSKRLHLFFQRGCSSFFFCFFFLLQEAREGKKPKPVVLQRELGTAAGPSHTSMLETAAHGSHSTSLPSPHRLFFLQSQSPGYSICAWGAPRPKFQFFLHHLVLYFPPEALRGTYLMDDW